MDAKKIIEKLEHDLSHFLIEEACKKDATKRGSPEMYKYRGLNIMADPDSKAQEKTISIRIGALEAEFKIDNGDKNSGALNPEDERNIMLWMVRSENAYNLKALFAKKVEKKQIPIIPFDLENLYDKA